MKVCDIGIRLKILRKEGQRGKRVGEEEEEQREVRDEERNMCTGTRSGRHKRGRRGKGEGDGERRRKKIERGGGHIWDTANDDDPLHHHTNIVHDVT